MLSFMSPDWCSPVTWGPKKTKLGPHPSRSTSATSQNFQFLGVYGAPGNFNSLCWVLRLMPWTHFLYFFRPLPLASFYVLRIPCLRALFWASKTRHCDIAIQHVTKLCRLQWSPNRQAVSGQRKASAKDIICKQSDWALTRFEQSRKGAPGPFQNISRGSGK